MVYVIHFTVIMLAVMFGGFGGTEIFHATTTCCAMLLVAWLTRYRKFIKLQHLNKSNLRKCGGRF
jgi:hypothetical protein